MSAIIGRLLSLVRIIPEYFSQLTGLDPKELLAPYCQMTKYLRKADGRSRWANSTTGKIGDNALIRVNLSLALFLGLPQ